MNAAFMLEVARAIEGLPYLDPNDPRPQEEPGFFTMAAVAYPCGTPGCIAGWAERLLRCPKGREPPPIHDEREALVGAAERFGITAKQAFWRFEPRFERADVAAMPTEGGHLRRARCGGGWSRARPRPRTAAGRRSGVRARREDALEPIEGTPPGKGGERGRRLPVPLTDASGASRAKTCRPALSARRCIELRRLAAGS